VDPGKDPIVDKETGWRVPDICPPDIDLTMEEYEELKELLAEAIAKREPKYSLATLEKHGYTCWLHYLMHQYACYV
jgi:hypothetical protein